uniref:6-phosphogluconate dehydrogenase NADP-binding domain-containing protein n=1 Tax=Romanomermis culicivorax TaxID=13658 RepID=A0A915IBX1_ROMCU
MDCKYSLAENCGRVVRGFRDMIRVSSEEKSEVSPSFNSDEELEKQELVKTPKEVAEKCDVLCICVAKSEDLKDIVCDPVTGVLDSIDETKALVDFSTLDLVTTLEISRLITDKRGRYMDAPLFGTLQQARENMLTVFCSGDKSLFKDVQDCLHGTFLSSLYVGPVGTASKIVLILQMLHGVVTASVAEILSLTDVLGIQSKYVNEIFQRTNVDSWIIDAATRVAEDNFVPAATELGTIREQVKNATNTITTYFDQPIPITSLVSQLYGLASRNGDFIDHDCTSISRALGSSQRLTENE